MNDLEDNDITLTGNVATYSLPQTHGEIHGTYAGMFQFKCFLTPSQELEAGREYRSLLGSNLLLASEKEGQMAFCLTQLKHRIIKAPPFWTSTLQDSTLAGDLPDLNILLLVLDASMRAQELYKTKMAKEREVLLDKSIEVAEKILKDGNQE